MPGWTARVDGVLTPIFAGNLAQRVIPLTRPGGHIIALDYRAAGFGWDVVDGILGMAGWAYAFLFVSS